MAGTSVEDLDRRARVHRTSAHSLLIRRFGESSIRKWYVRPFLSLTRPSFTNFIHIKPPKAPIGNQLTLRFKHHKTTILLHVAQSQSFTSIKADLLSAIKATGISDINGTTLPSDPEAIVFGIPIDKHDVNKGWMPLKIPEVEDGELAKGKGVKKGSVLNENPLGAGLKDGAVLAFRFVDEEEEDNDGGEGDGWDVVMPSYDDEALSQGGS